MKTVHFTIPKSVAITLPLNLVCKKTGYLRGIGPDGSLTDNRGPRFCQMGKSYRLIEVLDVDSPDGPDFIMLTETILEDGSIVMTEHHEDGSVVMTEHHMKYEFLAEHFHVTF